MKFLLILAVLPFLCLGTKVHYCSDKNINSINKKQGTWVAGRNFLENTPPVYPNQLASSFAHPRDRNIFVKIHTRLTNIPENFDAREHLDRCNSIKEVRNQQKCNSCWAFSTVEVISDRVCIASNGTINVKFSPEDLINCCGYCGNCAFGWPSLALKFWVKSGLVTGGDYGSNEGCQPYSKQTVQGQTHACSTTCLNGNYSKSYYDDRNYGKSSYQIARDIRQIQTEILTNGPVTGTFTVYEDFLCYKSGVYIHTVGKKRIQHVTKIIGWGTENETPYWLIANSWGPNWGDGGFFKILRGKNHCGIEDANFAGIPR